MSHIHAKLHTDVKNVKQYSCVSQCVNSTFTNIFSEKNGDVFNTNFYPLYIGASQKIQYREKLR